MTELTNLTVENKNKKNRGKFANYCSDCFLIGPGLKELKCNCAPMVGPGATETVIDLGMFPFSSSLTGSSVQFTWI